MPRFYFNIYDGIDAPDRTGTEFPNWQAARVEAVRLAGVIFQGDAARIALGEEWRMEVTDNTGLILFRLDFASFEAPALSSGRSDHDKKN